MCKMQISGLCDLDLWSGKGILTFLCLSLQFWSSQIYRAVLSIQSVSGDRAGVLITFSDGSSLFSLPKYKKDPLIYNKSKVTICAWKTNKISMKYVKNWN